METVKVSLAPEEYSALVRLCDRELRDVPDQVRHIVRETLRRQRLLTEEGAPKPREVCHA